MTDELRMTTDRIPLDNCTLRSVYRVRARNFHGDVAVYTGNGAFIGIRTKLGQRYLDVEYHWEADPRHGTVSPIQLIGRIPKIPLGTSIGTVCKHCYVTVEWTGPPIPAPWKHTAPAPTSCVDPSPIAISNDVLYRILDAIESAVEPLPRNI